MPVPNQGMVLSLNSAPVIGSYMHFYTNLRGVLTQTFDNRNNPTDPNNPYAYAQTSEDLLRLPTRLEALTRQNPNPRISVVAADAWPLPWYLRKFSQVGFWQPGQDPGSADYFITSTDAAEKLGDELKNFRPEYFGVRPEVLMILWVPEKPGTGPSPQAKQP